MDAEAGPGQADEAEPEEEEDTPRKSWIDTILEEIDRVLGVPPD